MILTKLPMASPAPKHPEQGTLNSMWERSSAQIVSGLSIHRIRLGRFAVYARLLTVGPSGMSRLWTVASATGSNNNELYKETRMAMRQAAPATEEKQTKVN